MVPPTSSFQGDKSDKLNQLRRCNRSLDSPISRQSGQSLKWIEWNQKHDKIINPSWYMVAPSHVWKVTSKSSEKFILNNSVGNLDISMCSVFIYNFHNCYSVQRQGNNTFVIKTRLHITIDLYSLSGRASYRKVLRSLEAARFGFRPFQSLWNFTGTSVAALPRYLPHFRAIRPSSHPISQLRDFTRLGGKTYYRLVNKDPNSYHNKTQHSAYASIEMEHIP